MLDFRVQTFLQVCEKMSYTRAAEALNLTQPAVSQHIKYLETYYDTKLFLMAGKKLVITEAGRQLRSAFLTMQQDEAYMLEQLKASKRKKGKIRLGATLTIGEYVVAESLSSYFKKEPDSDMIVHIGNTSDLTQMLNHGEIDFAFVEGIFDSSEYETEVYSKEPFIAVSAQPLQIKQAKDILNENLIIREEGSGSRAIFEKMLELNNISLSAFRNLIEVNSIAVIKQMVKNGCGITFIYEKAVEQELKEKSLYRIPLPDMETVHDFTYIWRKGSLFGEEYREIIRKLMG